MTGLFYFNKFAFQRFAEFLLELVANESVLLTKKALFLSFKKYLSTLNFTCIWNEDFM